MMSSKLLKGVCSIRVFQFHSFKSPFIRQVRLRGPTTCHVPLLASDGGCEEQQSPSPEEYLGVRKKDSLQSPRAGRMANCSRRQYSPCWESWQTTLRTHTMHIHHTRAQTHAVHTHHTHTHTQHVPCTHFTCAILTCRNTYSMYTGAHIHSTHTMLRSMGEAAAVSYRPNMQISQSLVRTQCLAWGPWHQKKTTENYLVFN